APASARVLVATPDRAKGTLVAKLAPRGTVELVAVSEQGAAPNAWWNPQGEAVPNTLYEIVHPDRSKPTDRLNRNLLVRWRDLPSGASGPTVEFVNAYGGNGGRELLRDGKLLAGSLPLSGSFAPGATQGAVRLGFGLASWKTVSIHDADG